MKKLLAIFVCLLLAFSLVACGGNQGADSSQNDSQPSGNNPPVYYPDEEIAGQNTFTLIKKSKDGNNAVITLKVGGTDVKFAGFKIIISFDKKIEISEISPASDFMAITENKETAGRLTLLWAGTQNITSETEICDIALDTKGASNLTFKVEIAHGGLGYLNEESVPPVRNVRGNGSEFKLA